MFKQLALATTTILLTGVVMAAPVVPGTYALDDGSTLHLFENGKMGMENRLGFAVFMDENAPMKRQDGRQIRMQGNEVARVSQIVRSVNN